MHFFRFLLIIMFSAIMIFPSCSEDPGNGDDSMGNILGDSIIDLPQSLTGGSTEKSSHNNGDPCSCDGSDDSMIDVYQGIRCYVRIAEEVKRGVKEIVINVGNALPYIPRDVEYHIDNPDDNLRRVLVEKPETGDYEWKVSFFYTETGIEPEMILRFTIDGRKAKGRILWNIIEEDEELALAGIHLDITHALDVVFDSTTPAKKLEVKFSQDMGGIFSLENSGALDSLSDKMREKILGQPAKLFLNAELDLHADEFSIYGTSHHPGWSILNNEIFGEDRTMYLFKAKAKNSGSQYAKLYLSLPLETRETIDNIWTEDSVGVVVTDFLTKEVNRIIAKLHDDVDDAAEDPGNLEDPFMNDVSGEKLLADTLVLWITGSAPAAEEDYDISKTELEDFVFSSCPPDAEDFRNSYKSISYIINPAFYNKTDGFLGTYNESKDIFYSYTGSSLIPGAKPYNFDLMYGLDLTNISPYVPAEVVSSVITVE